MLLHKSMPATNGRPTHECGVCGVFGHKDSAKLNYFGLYALQHRGQESAGIVASDGSEVNIYKDMGLSLIHISEPTRPAPLSRMPSSA